MLVAQVSKPVELPPELRALAAVAERELRRALKQALKVITDDIRANIRGEDSFSSGALYRSIKDELFDERGTLRGRVFSTAAHAVWVERGRRPGKQPPKEAILDWMRARGMEADPAVAFLIARKIGREGIKARPFFQNAIDATAFEVGQIFERAAERVAARLAKQK